MGPEPLAVLVDVVSISSGEEGGVRLLSGVAAGQDTFQTAPLAEPFSLDGPLTTHPGSWVVP